jgi:hypothetical protein
MRLGNVKLVLLAIIVVVVLALIFSLFGGSFVQQNILFEDMTITKTINFGGERIETYSFELENPLIAYLVIPKTISESASEIKISGDFQFEVIEEDPIIKIMSSDFSPGTKKLIITMPTGDTNQTSILFPFPLAEYNNLGENEKQQLEETITQFAQSIPETFTLEKSKEIMQTYANDIKIQAINGELKSGEETDNGNLKKKASFDGLGTTLTNAVNSIQSFINIAQPIQTNTRTNNTTNLFAQAISSINGQTSISIPEGAENITMTIVFKPEEKRSTTTQTSYPLPEEIVLQYSENTPIIVWTAEIEKGESNPLPEEAELVIDGPENIRLFYEKVSEKGTSEKPVYTINLIIDTRNYIESLETKETVNFKHSNTLFSNPEQLKITLINNPCTEIIRYFYEPPTITSLISQKETDYEQALYETLGCTDTKAQEAIIKLLTEKKLFEQSEIKEAEKMLRVELDKTNISSETPDFAKLTKKIDATIQENSKRSSSKYERENEKLKQVTNEYNSILYEKVSTLKQLKEKTSEERTKDLAEMLIQKYELDIAEKQFALDPTNWRALEEIIQKKMFYLYLFNPNLTKTSLEWNEIEEDVRKEYMKKYSIDGYFSWEYMPFHLVETKIDQIDIRLNVLEDQLVEIVSNCKRKLEYENKWKEKCRNAVHQLATNDLSNEIFDVTRERVNPINFTPDKSGTQLFIEADYFDLENREMNSTKAGYDKDIEEKVDILKAQITRLVKQRTGLRLIGKQLVSPRDKTRLNEKLYEPSLEAQRYSGQTSQVNSFVDTQYEISVPENLVFANGEKTLLEIYEQIYSDDTSDWFTGKKIETKKEETVTKASFGPAIDWHQTVSPQEEKYAAECIIEAFRGPLKDEIETIKHFKFLPHVITIPQAAQLQDEITFVEHVASIEEKLATMRLAKVTKQAKINYILSYMITSRIGFYAYAPAEANERSYATIQGLEAVQRELLKGKNLLEIRNDAKAAVVAAIGKEPEYIEYSIDCDFGGEHGAVSGGCSNEAEVDAWLDTLYNLRGDIGELWLAVQQPIMEIEIKKLELMAENQVTKKEEIAAAYALEDSSLVRELTLPTIDAARFAVEVGDYYYESKLYNEATSQYISILTYYEILLNEYPELNTILENPRSRTSSSVFSILFGARAKEYWSSIGEVGRELVTLENVAYYVAVGASLRYLTHLARTNIAYGQGIKLVRHTGQAVGGSETIVTITGGTTEALSSSQSMLTVVNGSELVSIGSLAGALAYTPSSSRILKIFSKIKHVLTKPIGNTGSLTPSQLKRMKQLQEAYAKGASKELARQLNLKSVAELKSVNLIGSEATGSQSVLTKSYLDHQKLLKAWEKQWLKGKSNFEILLEQEMPRKISREAYNARKAVETSKQVAAYDRYVSDLKKYRLLLQQSNSLSPETIETMTTTVAEQINLVQDAMQITNPVTINCTTCTFWQKATGTAVTTTTESSEFTKLLGQSFRPSTVAIPDNIIAVANESTVSGSTLSKIIVEPIAGTGATIPLATASAVSPGVLKLSVFTDLAIRATQVDTLPEENEQFDGGYVKLLTERGVEVEIAGESENSTATGLEVLGYTFPYATEAELVASPEVQALKEHLRQNSGKASDPEQAQAIANITDDETLDFIEGAFAREEIIIVPSETAGAQKYIQNYVQLGILDNAYIDTLVDLSINLQAIEYSTALDERDARILRAAIEKRDRIVNYLSGRNLDPSQTVEETLRQVVSNPGSLENWQNFNTAFENTQKNLTEEQALQVLDAFHRTGYSAQAIPATEEEVERATELSPKATGETAAILGSDRLYIAGVESKSEDLYKISIIFEELFNQSYAFDAIQSRSLSQTNSHLSKWLTARVGSAQESFGSPTLLRGDETSLRSTAPAIAAILLDPAKSKALLEGLTTIRSIYPAARKNSTLSNDASQIWISDNVFVRPGTSSFRRHFITETDAAGNVIASVEIKIPGTYRHKLKVGEADYDVSQELGPAFGEDLQKGISVIRYADGDYSWYGQTMAFGEFVPMQIIVSEMSPTAFQNRQRLSEFLKSANITIDEFKSIKTQVLALTEKVFDNKWTGNGDLVHLQNFTIEKLGDGSYKVRLVNDLAEFKPMSEMTQDEIDNSLQNSRYRIESELILKEKHVTRADRRTQRKLSTPVATEDCVAGCEVVAPNVTEVVEDPEQEMLMRVRGDTVVVNDLSRVASTTIYQRVGDLKQTSAAISKAYATFLASQNEEPHRSTLNRISSGEVVSPRDRLAGLGGVAVSAKAYFIDGELVNLSEYIRRSYAKKGLDVEIVQADATYTPTKEEYLGFLRIILGCQEPECGSTIQAQKEYELFEKYKEETIALFDEYIGSGLDSSYEQKMLNLLGRIGAETGYRSQVHERITEFYIHLQNRIPVYRLKMTAENRYYHEAIIFIDDLGLENSNAEGFAATVDNKIFVVAKPVYSRLNENEEILDILLIQRNLIHEIDHAINRQLFSNRTSTDEDTIASEGLATHAEISFLEEQRREILARTGQDIGELAELETKAYLQLGLDRYKLGFARISQLSPTDRGKLYTGEMATSAIPEVSDILAFYRELLEDAMAQNTTTITCASPCRLTASTETIERSSDGTVQTKSPNANQRTYLAKQADKWRALETLYYSTDSDLLPGFFSQRARELALAGIKDGLLVEAVHSIGATEDVVAPKTEEERLKLEKNQKLVIYVPQPLPTGSPPPQRVAKYTIPAGADETTTLSEWLRERYNFWIPRAVDIKRIFEMTKRVSTNEKPIIVSVGSGSCVAEYLLAKEGAEVVAVEPNGKSISTVVEAYDLIPHPTIPNAWIPSPNGKTAGLSFTLIQNTSDDFKPVLNKLGIQTTNYSQEIIALEKEVEKLRAQVATQAEQLFSETRGRPMTIEQKQRYQQIYTGLYIPMTEKANAVQELKARENANQATSGKTVDTYFAGWMPRNVDYKLYEHGGKLVIYAEHNAGLTGTTVTPLDPEFVGQPMIDSLKRNVLFDSYSDLPNYKLVDSWTGSHGINTEVQEFNESIYTIFEVFARTDLTQDLPGADARPRYTAPGIPRAETIGVNEGELNQVDIDMLAAGYDVGLQTIGQLEALIAQVSSEIGSENLTPAERLVAEQVIVQQFAPEYALGVEALFENRGIGSMVRHDAKNMAIGIRNFLFTAANSGSPGSADAAQELERFETYYKINRSDNEIGRFNKRGTQMWEKLPATLHVQNDAELIASLRGFDEHTATVNRRLTAFIARNQGQIDPQLLERIARNLEILEKRLDLLLRPKKVNVQAALEGGQRLCEGCNYAILGSAGAHETWAPLDTTIDNLVQNSVKALREAKAAGRVEAGRQLEITIVVGEIIEPNFGRRLEISFQDNAGGIDREAIIRKANELGYNVPADEDEEELVNMLMIKGLTTGSEGHGEGLYAVSMTLEEHGGNIQASPHTTPNGQTGLEFTVRTPVGVPNSPIANSDASNNTRTEIKMAKEARDIEQIKTTPYGLVRQTRVNGNSHTIFFEGTEPRPRVTFGTDGSITTENMENATETIVWAGSLETIYQNRTFPGTGRLNPILTKDRYITAERGNGSLNVMERQRVQVGDTVLVGTFAVINSTAYNVSDTYTSKIYVPESPTGIGYHFQRRDGVILLKEVGQHGQEERTIVSGEILEISGNHFRITNVESGIEITLLREGESSGAGSTTAQQNQASTAGSTTIGTSIQSAKESSPVLNELFNANPSLENHTAEVLATAVSIEGRLPNPHLRNSFRGAVLVHDLGKPDAGESREQFDETHALLTGTPVLDELGLSQQEQQIVTAIVEGDPIGSFLKDEMSAEEAAQQINLSAQSAGLTTEDFFRILEAFYISDVASYPILRENILDSGLNIIHPRYPELRAAVLGRDNVTVNFSALNETHAEHFVRIVPARTSSEMRAARQWNRANVANLSAEEYIGSMANSSGNYFSHATKMVLADIIRSPRIQPRQVAEVVGGETFERTTTDERLMMDSSVIHARCNSVSEFFSRDDIVFIFSVEAILQNQGFLASPISPVNGSPIRDFGIAGLTDNFTDASHTVDIRELGIVFIPEDLRSQVEQLPNEQTPRIIFYGEEGVEGKIASLMQQYGIERKGRIVVDGEVKQAGTRNLGHTGNAVRPFQESINGNDPIFVVSNESQTTTTMQSIPTNDPQKLAALGEKLYGFKSFSNAENIFKQALKLDPNNALANYGIARLFANRDNTLAQKAIDTALENGIERQLDAAELESSYSTRVDIIRNNLGEGTISEEQAMDLITQIKVKAFENFAQNLSNTPSLLTPFVTTLPIENEALDTVYVRLQSTLAALKQSSAQVRDSVNSKYRDIFYEEHGRSNMQWIVARIRRDVETEQAPNPPKIVFGEQEYHLSQGISTPGYNSTLIVNEEAEQVAVPTNAGVANIDRWLKLIIEIEENQNTQISWSSLPEARDFPANEVARRTRSYETTREEFESLRRNGVENKITIALDAAKAYIERKNGPPQGILESWFGKNLTPLKEASDNAIEEANTAIENARYTLRDQVKRSFDRQIRDIIYN